MTPHPNATGKKIPPGCHRIGGRRDGPAPRKPPTETRKVRMSLDTFVYNCTACDKEMTHSSGYLFVVMFELDWLYFCNIDCCDEWEKYHIKVKVEPATDRRGAIAATKAKNEEDDLRT